MAWQMHQNWMLLLTLLNEGFLSLDMQMQSFIITSFNMSTLTADEMIIYLVGH